jgi:hypothetical protein
MTNFGLQPTVSGLTPGVAYNLYEYQFNSPANDTLGGNGTWAGTAAAALAVPITAFNANSAAGGSTPYSKRYDFYRDRVHLRGKRTLVTTSDQIVVYRAVPGLAGTLQSGQWFHADQHLGDVRVGQLLARRRSGLWSDSLLAGRWLHPRGEQLLLIRQPTHNHVFRDRKYASLERHPGVGALVVQREWTMAPQRL